MNMHGVMDVDHMASLNRLLKTIANPAAQAAIIRSTNVNFHQFWQIFPPGGSLAPA
jgi:hypothetical protein